MSDTPSTLIERLLLSCEDEESGTRDTNCLEWEAAVALTTALKAKEELRWLVSHCRAIGMVKKSDSGTDSHDIALFTIDLKAAKEEAERNAQRLDWLERFLFERHWDGTIGRLSSWQMVGHYRHKLVEMRGETLRAAIDEAMKK